MKKYVLYLPQFHEIPENNEWWGKGFTEWVNVKRATPLYEGHVQPKIPLNNNYYDLSDIKTMVWQNELAKSYGIDGFVFYHYYFNGKHLLNKPVESLLNNPSIDMKFFFCWANHTWKKSWNGSSEILIEQTYGEQEDWIKHFDYLLPFFKDERYVKINNKPAFMLFLNGFDEYEPMFELFDEKCKENGFDGILIINSAHYLKDAQNKSNYSFETRCYLREPAVSTNIFHDQKKYSIWRIKNKIESIKTKMGIKAKVRKYTGNDLYNIMISYAEELSPNDVPGVFFEWDNTPRHGYRGYIITPPSKETFVKYMNVIKAREMVIINAWNEWAEGMMLEPSEELKYKYLEWIKEWK